MNLFEQELRRLFENNNIYSDTKFIGRTCYMQISGNIKARIEFDIPVRATGHYEAISVRVVNKNEGQIDKNTIYFKDLFLDKQIENLFISDGEAPSFWSCGAKYEWGVYGEPTTDDYKKISDTVYDYLEIFHEPVEEQTENMGQNLGM